MAGSTSRAIVVPDKATGLRKKLQARGVPEVQFISLRAFFDFAFWYRARVEM